jgi:hypothetical protein
MPVRMSSMTIASIFAVAVGCSHQMTNERKKAPVPLPGRARGSQPTMAPRAAASVRRGPAPHAGCWGNGRTTVSGPARRDWPPKQYPHFWQRYETGFAGRPFPSRSSVIVSIGRWQVSQPRYVNVAAAKLFDGVVGDLQQFLRCSINSRARTAERFTRSSK